MEVIEWNSLKPDIVSPISDSHSEYSFGDQWSAPHTDRIESRPIPSHNNVDCYIKWTTISCVLKVDLK